MRTTDPLEALAVAIVVLSTVCVARGQGDTVKGLFVYLDANRNTPPVFIMYWPAVVPHRP